MKLIKFKELRETLGNSFIALTVRNFPQRNYRYKTVDNVIYLLAKPDVKINQLEQVKRISNGKDIRFCVLPNEVIEAVGI